MNSSTLSRLATATLPTRFTRRACIIRSGDPLPYRASTWTGTLVLITEGQLELVLRDGSRVVFDQDAVLTLDGLDLQALRSIGSAPTVLVTITRDRPPAEPADCSPRPHPGAAARDDAR